METPRVMENVLFGAAILVVKNSCVGHDVRKSPDGLVCVRAPSSSNPVESLEYVEEAW